MTSGEVQPPFFTAFATLLVFGFFNLFGHLRDFFRGRRSGSKTEGYAPIRQDYEDFYTRRLYYRIHDCWNRPICSAPDAWIDVMTRTPVHGQRPLSLTGGKQRCLNLGSYNYLGFAASDEYCTPRVQTSLAALGWATASSRADAGTTPVHIELEREVAAFLGKEDALTFGMGFATNSVIIPALVGKGCLILSDALNHASIVAGVRGSGAKVKVFAHNSPDNLEATLRAAIAEGQPRTHRPWRKVLIIVEGIYSMEGEKCALAEIVAIKKKYKAYLYLDEAHSIGALGAGGRGICQTAGVDPADVDVMMGTFTKSFGSCGGYIGGNRDLIQHLRAVAPAHIYATSMSVPATQQILSAIRLINGEDGSSRGREKIASLHANANYFRRRLKELGHTVLGDWDSPVMPIMIYNPAKMAAWSRYLLARGVAAVVVGFPATSLLTARARICISAAHTREDLDWALQIFKEAAEMCLVRQHEPTPALLAEVARNYVAHLGTNGIDLPDELVKQYLSDGADGASNGEATAEHHGKENGVVCGAKVKQHDN